MTAAELSARLKRLLSIRAVLQRGGVSVSSFYTQTSLDKAIPPKNRTKIQRALLDTATALVEIAVDLGADEDSPGAEQRSSRYVVVRRAASLIEGHGVRTRLDMHRALSDAEERVLRHAFKVAFNRSWSDDSDMIAGIREMYLRLSETENVAEPKCREPDE